MLRKTEMFFFKVVKQYDNENLKLQLKENLLSPSNYKSYCKQVVTVIREF